MKIVVIGSGYVGLVTGICLSNLGNFVTCVDIDLAKIESLKNGILPIYEPGLQELLVRNTKVGRLKFSNVLSESLPESDIVFIAVGTPSKYDGSADLQYVEAAAESIGVNLKKYTVVVNKSTVPVGTGDRVSEIISQKFKGAFDVVSNPEFLREGSAINDFMQPDRIVIGCDKGSKGIEIIKSLYQPLNCPIIVTDVKSSEMIKYASNAFLATSISFINSIANICEKVGADVTKVTEGMKLDKRIGKHAFLTAGCGYGGSCFPKDVQAMISIGKKHAQDFSILEQVEIINEQMKIKLFEVLKKHYADLSGRKIVIWGLSFKPNTDDVRYSPATELIRKLLEAGAIVNAYDPIAQVNMQKIFPHINYFDDPYLTAKNGEALIICTDWDEFKQINQEKLRTMMQGNLILDGRNIFKRQAMAELGFNYFSIGRP